jgi:hypothetical protein
MREVEMHIMDLNNSNKNRELEAATKSESTEEEAG